MREIRLSGSVRGVRRNPYPYRDLYSKCKAPCPSVGRAGHARRTRQTQASRPGGWLAVAAATSVVGKLITYSRHLSRSPNAVLHSHLMFELTATGEYREALQPD
jgi:hypothetical protein